MRSRVFGLGVGLLSGTGAEQGIRKRALSPQRTAPV